MNERPITFAILYGIAEGPAVGRRLRSVLGALGLSEAASPDAADIIITHSGGIIDIPRDAYSKTILIIAPSLGRKHQSMIGTELEKMSRDVRTNIGRGDMLRWIRLVTWNTWYLISQPKRLGRIWTTHKLRGQNLPSFDAQNVVVISYKDDPWSAFVPLNEPKLHPKYQFLSIDAAHDDLWLYPERYVMYFGIHQVSQDNSRQ